MSGVPFSRSTQESTVLSIAAHTSPAVVRVAGLQVADESLFEVRGVTERGGHVHLLCSYRQTTQLLILRMSQVEADPASNFEYSRAQFTHYVVSLPP